MERLLNQVMEGMDQDDLVTKSAPLVGSSSAAKHTSPSASDPAANSSTAAGNDLIAKSTFLMKKPASLATSTGTTEANKKGSPGAINNKNDGVTVNRPRSSAFGMCILPSPLAYSFYLFYMLS